MALECVWPLLDVLRPFSTQHAPTQSFLNYNLKYLTGIYMIYSVYVCFYCVLYPCVIRRHGEACTVFLLLCRIQNLLLILHPNFFIPPTSKSKIPQIQNPQNPQNPKSPNLGRWGPHIKICYITVQNPKSKIKIQNPQTPKSPKS